MKPVFTPEDFDPGIGPADDGKDLCTYRWAANRANAKIESLLGPEVFATVDEGLTADEEDAITLQTYEDVITEALVYLEAYDKSPFDSNSELANYIRLRLNLPKLPESVTAEDLLREVLRTVEVPSQLSNDITAFLGGIPTQAEVDKILTSGVVKLKGTSRVIGVATSYATGWSIEEIAQDLNVTRERIRQILAKFWRQHSRGAQR